jgi:hypothetical protein
MYLWSSQSLFLPLSSSLSLPLSPLSLSPLFSFLFLLFIETKQWVSLIFAIISLWLMMHSYDYSSPFSLHSLLKRRGNIRNDRWGPLGTPLLVIWQIMVLLRWLSTGRNQRANDNMTLQLQANESWKLNFIKSWNLTFLAGKIIISYFVLFVYKPRWSTLFWKFC